MADLTFPSLLPIPLAVAATSEFISTVPGHSPARDLAWIFAALHAATMTEQNSGGFWLLNEKGLRAAVGQIGKQRADAEFERWERLSRTMIMIGREAYPAPTAGVNAITPAGEAHWTIDRELVDQWRIFEQTRAVYVPLRLLQLAKSRTTIMLGLRTLAWRAGAAPAGSVLHADSNTLSLRLSVDELRRELGLSGVETKYLVRDHLAPAAAELERLMVGIVASIEPVWTLKLPRPTTIRRRSQILGFDVTLAWDNKALTPVGHKVPFRTHRRRNDQSEHRRPKHLPLLDRTESNVVPFPDDDVGFVDLSSLPRRG